MRRIESGFLPGDEIAGSITRLDPRRLAQRVVGEGFGSVDVAVRIPDGAAHELVAVGPEVAGDDDVAVGVEFKHGLNSV